MEAVSKNESGRFLNAVKRIWDGPNFNESEGASDILLEKFKAMKLSTNNVTDFKIEVKADEPVEPMLNSPKNTEQIRPDLQPLKPDFQSLKPLEIASDDYNSPQQLTIISKGTILTGDIKSDGNFEIYGTVTGSINTTGNIKVRGKQVGDMQGANISLSSCMVRGNLTAAEDMSIDSDSIIIGDIKAKRLSIDGKLQGNIYAKTSVTCQSNAIVMGDLTAATVTMENGARLNGKMQISNGKIEDIKIPEDGQKTPTMI